MLLLLGGLKQASHTHIHSVSSHRPVMGKGEQGVHSLIVTNNSQVPERFKKTFSRFVITFLKNIEFFPG